MMLIYINENIRFIEEGASINEGGLARNIAFMNWIYHNKFVMKEIKLHKNRIYNIFKVFWQLFIRKNTTLFFQYTTVGVPLHNNKIYGKAISAIFLGLIRRALCKNKIIFDVSDLKYEQSRDLALDLPKLESIKNFEASFFKLKVKFIFASYSMRDYACLKYKINRDDTWVCVNGSTRKNKKIHSSEIINQFSSNIIKYVYAGTLNKGRQIENMIKAFPEDVNKKLFLLGANGEWLENAIYKSNIIYIGCFPEEEAHYLVSLCDIGLIPYDDTKLYYNLAYPTKISFYLTAGITFLSTKVKEVEYLKNKYNIGYIANLSNWEQVIGSMPSEELEHQKIIARTLAEKFTWEQVFLDGGIKKLFL